MKNLEPNSIMESGRHLVALSAISFLMISPCGADAQNAPTTQPPPALLAPVVPPTSLYAPRVIQRYGMPGLPNQPFPPTDPATGLPMAQTAPEWKDPAWKDPAKVLAEVNFDGLPVADIANYMRAQFSNDFDVLIPDSYIPSSNPTPPQIDPNTGLPIQSSNEQTDVTKYKVRLQLRNATASEVFNAMNLLFEDNRTTLRWDLRMNGKRQIALLRVLQDPLPADVFRKPELKRVYFVGNLIGDETSGGMSMADLVKTISELEEMAYHQTGAIQFHEKAQLLIVTGTDDQINFIQQALEALNTKVAMERGRMHEAEWKTNNGGQKSSGSGGSK